MSQNRKFVIGIIEEGILKAFYRFAIIVGFIVSISYILNYIPIMKDDTDPKWGRSGMAIKVDHLTGCEYLSGVGGLTPRLDVEGSQICRSH